MVLLQGDRELSDGSLSKATLYQHCARTGNISMENVIETSLNFIGKSVYVRLIIYRCQQTINPTHSLR